MEKSIKFLITHESERLGRWLRLLGFDVVIFKGKDARQLYALAYAEGMAVLTRNCKLKKAPLLKVVHIKSQNILRQMKEAVKKLRLKIKSADIFHRCSLCNRILKDITRLKVKNRVPAFVYKTQKYFSYCSNCKKIYWQGTHLDRARGVIYKVASRA